MDFEENTFISFCFCAGLYCYLSGDENPEPHLEFLRRSLPGLKLFRDLSTSTIETAYLAGISSLLEASRDDDRDLIAEANAHMVTLDTNRVGEAIFTFLLSFQAYFDEITDSQAQLLSDVAEICGVDTVFISMSDRMNVLRLLHTSMPGAD
ncbi:MAG: hypothetical protein K8F31_07135 [Roseovarius sp.]|nr:hypothetical protein [Roseovarius sp.]